MVGTGGRVGGGSTVGTGSRVGGGSMVGKTVGGVAELKFRAG